MTELYVDSDFFVTTFGRTFSDFDHTEERLSISAYVPVYLSKYDRGEMERLELVRKMSHKALPVNL